VSIAGGGDLVLQLGEVGASSCFALRQGLVIDLPLGWLH
jgi:hypothetical protein